MALRRKATYFAQRLIVLRNRAGLTQAELAERADLHKLTVAQLEQGTREPSWATILSLASALGVRCTDFEVSEAEKKKAKIKRPRGRPRKTTGP
jgi:transcriptional regulator with XRE-family HTH domain